MMSNKLLRHLVLFGFKSMTTPEQSCTQLPDWIEEIHNYGRDI